VELFFHHSIEHLGARFNARPGFNNLTDLAQSLKSSNRRIDKLLEKFREREKPKLVNMEIHCRAGFTLSLNV